MSCHYMKRHGKNWNAYDEVKKDNLKRLHTICFQLYDILEKKTIEIVKKELVIASGWGMRGMNSRVQRILGHWKYSV